MKTIVEYLINNHIHSHKIDSPFKMQYGDYFKAEWDGEGNKNFIIGKFDKIMHNYLGMENAVSMIVSYQHVTNNNADYIKVDVNCKLTADPGVKNVRYMNPSDDELTTLQEIEAKFENKIKTAGDKYTNIAYLDNDLNIL